MVVRLCPDGFIEKCIADTISSKRPRKYSILFVLPVSDVCPVFFLRFCDGNIPFPTLHR